MNLARQSYLIKKYNDKPNGALTVRWSDWLYFRHQKGESMERLVLFEKPRKPYKRWRATIGGIDVSCDTYPELKEKVIKILEEELERLRKED